MSQRYLPHPDELQLQSYLDGELGPEPARRLQDHLAQCAACAQGLQEWRALEATLRQTRPSAELFAGEGEFWARLAGKLPQPRPTPWSLIGYLPPFLLGALGTLLDGLISAVLFVYVLMRLGVIPSIGAAALSWLRALLSSSLLENSLYAGLGWSSAEVTTRAMLWWSNLTRSSQETLLAGIVLLSLGCVMAVIVLLYLSWAMCWPHAAELEHEGGQ